MSYRKVGGLHHVKVGRLGFSFYWKRALIRRVRITKRQRKYPHDLAILLRVTTELSNHGYCGERHSLSYLDR